MDVVFVKIVFFVKFMKEIRIKNYTYFDGYFQFFFYCNAGFRQNIIA